VRPKPLPKPSKESCVCGAPGRDLGDRRGPLCLYHWGHHGNLRSLLGIAAGILALFTGLAALTNPALPSFGVTAGLISASILLTRSGSRISRDVSQARRVEVQEQHREKRAERSKLLQTEVLTSPRLDHEPPRHRHRS